jgi:penicillin-binding protein 2
MYQPRINREIGPLVLTLFRLMLIVLFVVMVGRLFQLQVLQGRNWLARANEQRFQTVETRPLRGVIYDAKGTILARNRPSFEVALIPGQIEEDDPTTESVNEEAEALVQILRILRADVDPDIAVRIQELMFRRLQSKDYREVVEGLGLPLSFIEVPDPSYAVTSANTPSVQANSILSAVLAISQTTPISPTIPTVLIPDTTQPLPLAGVVALVQRLMELRRAGGSSIPVPIFDQVDRLQAFEIVENTYRLPGVRVNEVPVREYVYGDLFSHVLGFMAPIPAALAAEYQANGYNDPNERVGISGLEASYQDQLRGMPGYRNVEIDIVGREVRTLDQRDPVPGFNLVLGIDRRLQLVMSDALQLALDERRAKSGVAIAMNPATGLILGMVSLPSYDNNIFAEGINERYLQLQNDERKPLINYAIGGLYPPGSTYKMVPATAALTEGIIGPNDIVRDDGPLFLPNKFFPNDPAQAQKFVSWNHKLGINYGPINVVKALALSNDIYFYWIGGGYPPLKVRGLNDSLMAKWSELFGYGARTGIDLLGEVAYPIPDDQWKRQTWAESWTTGDSYNMSIGQGYMLATPLQVLVSAAAIANDGKIVAPQIVYQITDSAGGLQRDFQAKFVRDLPTTPEIIQYIQEGMFEAVQSGTAIASQLPNVQVAGKTGTAEYCDYKPKEFPPPSDGCRRDDKDNLPTHAWYVAYAPYESPEIIVIAFVYDGGEGSATALPVVRKTLEAYFGEIRSQPPNNS